MKLKRYLKTANLHLSRKPNVKVVAGAVAVAIIIACLVALIIGQSDKKNDTSQQTQRVVEVSMTASGFEPSSVLIEKGSQVVFLNKDSAMHQVTANPHPTHTDLPGLHSEILNQDQSYTYNADTSGTFMFHDEMNPTFNGTLEVK